MTNTNVRGIYFISCPSMALNVLGKKFGGVGLFVCFSGWKSVENVPKLVDEYMSKKIKVDEFVTHTLPFDKINEAFELMHAGKR